MRNPPIGDNDGALGQRAARSGATSRGVRFGVDRSELDLVGIKRWIGREDAIHRKARRDGGSDVVNRNSRAANDERPPSVSGSDTTSSRAAAKHLPRRGAPQRRQSAAHGTGRPVPAHEPGSSPLKGRGAMVTDKPPGRFRPCIACLLPAAPGGLEVAAARQRGAGAGAAYAPPAVEEVPGGAEERAAPHGPAATASQYGAVAVADCASPAAVEAPCACRAEDPAATASQYGVEAVADGASPAAVEAPCAWRAEEPAA
jgi:hypothetical protein